MEKSRSEDVKVAEWMYWDFLSVIKLFVLSKSYSFLTLFLCYDFSEIYFDPEIKCLIF